MRIVLSCIFAASLLFTIAPNSFSQSQSYPSVISIRPLDKIISCLVGNTIRVSGHVSSAHSLQTCQLFVDRRLVAQHDSAMYEDDYLFNLPLPNVGIHTLQVDYLLDSGSRISISNCTVNVIQQAPLLIIPFPHTGVTNADVKFQINSSCNFRTARVDFYFSGKLVSSTIETPYKVKLPIAVTPSGSYKFSYRAYDDSNDCFVSNEETIVIPHRIELRVPDTITITDGYENTALSPNIYNGFEMTKVSYLITKTASISLVSYSLGSIDKIIRSENLQMLTEDKLPLSGLVNLSLYPSSDYEITAHITGEDGNQYDSPPYKISITNTRNNINLPPPLAEMQQVMTNLLELNTSIVQYHELLRSFLSDFASEEAAEQTCIKETHLVSEYQILGDYLDAQAAQRVINQATSITQRSTDRMISNLTKAQSLYGTIKTNPLFSQFYHRDFAINFTQQHPIIGSTNSMLRMRSDPRMVAEDLFAIEPR